jgi:vacuolar-type H+-ATPase subunit H
MNLPRSVADAQLQHLLQVVERERDGRCRSEIEAAEQQAREIVRQAYREARAHAHADLEALREQVRQRLNSADARQQTRLRELRQQADQAFLDAAWQPLQHALLRRWGHAGHRQEWIAQLVETAAATLLNRNWLIEHPQAWPAAESEALRDRLTRDQTCTPHLAPDTGIHAGLRISAGGAVVDGSIEGLLRRRPHIEALLLAEIRKQHVRPD